MVTVAVPLAVPPPVLVNMTGTDSFRFTPVTSEGGSVALAKLGVKAAAVAAGAATVIDIAAEMLPACAASPPYVATIVAVPAARPAVESVAVPSGSTVAVPSTPAPSANVTVPVGSVPAAATRAANWTKFPLFTVGVDAATTTELGVVVGVGVGVGAASMLPTTATMFVKSYPMGLGHSVVVMM